jgi:outer membrane protein assembly factor BamB
MMMKSRSVVVALMMLCSAVCAGEPVAVEPPGGALSWYELTLENGLGEGVDVPMRVQVVGSEATAVAFATGAVIYVETDGITLKVLTDGSLTGQQRVRLMASKGAEMFLSVDAKRTALELAGTYTLHRSKGVTSNGTALEGQTDLTGKLTGRIIGEPELRARNAFTGKGHWDSYVGPNQNFSSVDVGVELVDNLKDARLMWISPFIGGMQIGDVRHGVRLYTPIVGGPATPLVYDKKVYQFHLVPTGDEIQTGYLDKAQGNQKQKVEDFARLTGRTVKQVMQRFAVRADEVVTCLDAETGKMLWRAKWPEAGVNLVGHKTALTNHTGCAGDGRVYAFSSIGVVRALDATTGKQLWETPIPGYHEAMKNLRDSGIAKPMSRSYAHGLNYIGSVVVAPTGTGRSGLAGFDGKTGELLWKGGVLGANSTPIRWSHGGKEYVLGANEDGKVVCIEPRTGKELWSIADAGNSEYQPSLEGDYLLTAAGCYKLDPAGATKLWDIDAKALFNSRSVGILYRGLAWIRTDQDSGGLIVRRASDGEVLATEPTRGPRAEVMTLATEGRIIYNHEAQHNSNHKFEFWPADLKTVKPLGPDTATWRPPHVVDLTYAIPVMYPIVEGRMFMRAADAIYCYDLRKREREDEN